MRIRTDEVCIELFEILEKRVDECLETGVLGAFVLLQHVADLQISIGLVETIPKVLAAADVARRNAAVVALVVPFGVQVRSQ